MKNLNAEQIKKALECCAAAHSSYCRQCPVDVKKQEDCECGTFLAGQALALINSQEQRIKELTEENAEVKANWQKLKDDYDNNDKEWREAYADAQSKWEKAYEKLELTLLGVMHSVDKWLDGVELEQDEVNRAITMREKTLQIVERLTEENERLRATKYYMHSDGRIEMIPTVESVKADTMRKMQERLKADAVTIQDHTGKLGVVVGVGNIDDVAREMLEGENENTSKH